MAVNNTQSAIYIESTCVNFTVSHNLMVICCKNHYGIFMPCIILVVKPGRLVGAVNNFSKHYPRLSFSCDPITLYKISYSQLFLSVDCYKSTPVRYSELVSMDETARGLRHNEPIRKSVFQSGRWYGIYMR